MEDGKAFANALMEGWMIDAVTESGEMYGQRLEGVNALRDWIGSDRIEAVDARDASRQSVCLPECWQQLHFARWMRACAPLG